MRGHKKKKMTRGQNMRVVVQKIIDGHRAKYGSECSDIVTNLIEGERVWTRVLWSDGLVQKINVACLEEVETNTED